jgi:hypothetical protein
MAIGMATTTTITPTITTILTTHIIGEQVSIWDTIGGILLIIAAIALLGMAIATIIIHTDGIITIIIGDIIMADITDITDITIIISAITIIIIIMITIADITTILLRIVQQLSELFLQVQHKKQ